MLDMFVDIMVLDLQALLRYFLDSAQFPVVLASNL